MSFLSAFNKAKDSTKLFVQSSSAKISHRLQINLSASPPNSPKLSPIGHNTKIFLDENSEVDQSHLVEAQSKTYNITESNVVAPNPVIKFSEPSVLSCNSEIDSINSPSNVKSLNLPKTNDINTNQMSPVLAGKDLNQALSKIELFSEHNLFENENPVKSKLYIEKDLANCSDTIHSNSNLLDINLNNCLSFSSTDNACNEVVEKVHGHDIPKVSIDNTDLKKHNLNPEDKLEHLSRAQNNDLELNFNPSVSPVISLPGHLSEPSHPISNESKFFDIVDPRKQCVFCLSYNHESHHCKKFNNSNQFWSKVYLERRCKNCLRQFHFSNSCFDRSFCNLKFCQRKDKHSPVLCKYRYQYFEQNYESKRPQCFQGQFQYSRGNEWDSRKYQKHRPQNIGPKELISQSSQD